MTMAARTTRSRPKGSAMRVAGKSAPRAGGALGVKAPVHSVAIGPGNTYSASAMVRSAFRSYEPLGYGLPWEVLDAVELLSTYNADYSQAVDNIRTLANSGHELFVQAKSQLQTTKLKTYLEGLAARIQANSGGMDGLVDKLLDQASVYGAMCGEWLVNEELTDVVEFADINPKSIRFFWDLTNEVWAPYQKVSAAQAQMARDNGQEVINSCVKLNPLTFHYYSFDAAPNSPYGTPPFVAALEHIGIQKDMIANMSQIVKKIGLLGMIDLVVQQLPMKPGETDEQYTTRANQYLSSYVDAAEDMARDGGMVHFDDVEIKATNLGGNAAGATNIYKQNEEMVFSGLKSMPSVQGRSYSTTETYAGVAYDIIIRNTVRYQRAVKRMVEAGYYLAANLSGYNPESIRVTFNPNKTLHRLQDAQAKTIEIKNAARLWKAGLLDQVGFGQEMGYSTIVTVVEEPPAELFSDRVTESTNTGNGSQNSDGGGKPNNQNNRGDS